MSCNLQLQRNTKVFLSTVDLAGTSGTAAEASTAMTAANTWQLEVLAGYAVSQAVATQDIVALESGTTPDRSSTRFITAVNPVDWSFQVYLRPTGIFDVDANWYSGVATNNSKPIADWAMWQALFSATEPGLGTASQSAWQDGGIFDTANRAATANVAAHNPNFGSAQELHMYFRMDNVLYQVSKASVNEATIDAAIDSIATVTWSGFGTRIDELTGTNRTEAVAVFGDFSTTANANAYNMTLTQKYHPWKDHNVAGTIKEAEFIKNRLSTISLTHTPENGSETTFSFPVTALSWTWNNNITFLTPEEISSLNTSVGNFAGSRVISGSLTAYLRHNDNNSAEFLRNILADTRTSHSTAATANIWIGGQTAPFVKLEMPAVQFEVPVHSIEEVISLTIGFQAQEPSTSCGTGGEVVMTVTRST